MWLLCTTPKHRVNIAATQETASHWNPPNLLNPKTVNIFKLVLYPNFYYNKMWFKSTSWKKVSNHKFSHSHNLLKFNICPQRNTRQSRENYELGRDTLPLLSYRNITNKRGALCRQRVTEYKIIAQVVELSATTLKIYVADFFPATGDPTENRPRGTTALMTLHFSIYIYIYIHTHTHNITHRMLQSVLEITSLNSQACLNSQELQYRETVFWIS